MAIDVSYAHNSVLSKLVLGETTYYYKDEDLRAAVEALGTAAQADTTATGVASEESGLVTGAQVYSYVTSAVAGLAGALHFKSGNRAAQSDPAAGDVVIEGTKEYVFDGSKWVELGDEGLWVPNTREVAGLGLASDISVAALQSALSLAAMAYASQGTVTVTDYATGITGASYTPEGSVTVTLSQTSTEGSITYGSYTPAGSIEVSAATAAGASYDKTTSVTVTTAAGTAETTNYTPSGDVNITGITVTPSSAEVATVTNAGTSYTLTSGSVEHADDTKASFLTAGTIASVSGETLTLTNPSSASAVTAVGAITYTDPTLSGALPTFGTKSVVTGISSATGTATFSGTGVAISASPNTTATAATMTQPTFTAEFTGSAADIKATSVKYDKATVSAAAFAGSEATITPTLQTGSKTLTVSPKAAE